MLESVSLFFFALATILFLGALAAAWVANSQPVSPRKGRAKFFAYASTGLAIISIGVPLLIHQATQQAVPFSGTIVAAHVTDNRASTLQVKLKNGCPLTLHANGTSPHFHPGQMLQGRYSARDSTLLSARFLDKNGKQQGAILNGHMIYLPYGIFLVGAFFVFAGWLLYRRDPTGANLDRNRS